MELLIKTQKLVEEIAKGIVRNEDAVRVTLEEKTDDVGDFTQMTIFVDDSDLSAIIGKEGATAGAIRRIAVLNCIKLGVKKKLLVNIHTPQKN